MAQAYRERSVLWDTLRRSSRRYDALLTPTMPITAFAVDLDRPVEIAGQPVRGLEWTPFTYPFNLNGVPRDQRSMRMDVAEPAGRTADRRAAVRRR